VQSHAAATGFVDAPVRVRRRSLVLASAGAAAALAVAWFGLPDRLTPPVAAQVRFEVRLAEAAPAPGLQVARVDTSGALVYVHPESVAGNDDIAHASVIDNGSDQFSVGVQFLPGGADRMRRATAAHVGRPLVILLDGVVVMAPTVRSAIGDAAVISGPFTKDEAARIAAGIERR
jgi:preprotein translocase subunit SecD